MGVKNPPRWVSVWYGGVVHATACTTQITQRVGGDDEPVYHRDHQGPAIIDGVEVTADTLTGRGGLSLFVRYLRGIGVAPQLETFFGSLRRSRKGQAIAEVFKQLFCFFVDGTSRHLVYFDTLQDDEGYARATETAPEGLLSSHAVKRFFRGFWWPRIYLFRRLLQRLFLWRLRLERPEVVILGLDTMVMDNDEAEARHGVKPTYKRVKGFQPLQMSWGRFVIDAVFRGGDKHSNHADTVEQMVRHVVRQIRKHYRAEVPIVIRLDSGFFDQKLFAVFEELKIGYLCGGKLYEDLQGVRARGGPECLGPLRAGARGLGVCGVRGLPGELEPIPARPLLPACL